MAPRGCPIQHRQVRLGKDASCLTPPLGSNEALIARILEQASKRVCSQRTGVDDWSSTSG